MSHVGPVVRHVATVPVLLGFLHRGSRHAWWHRWIAYAPSVPQVHPTHGLTRWHAEHRVRSSLIDHHLGGAR